MVLAHREKIENITYQGIRTTSTVKDYAKFLNRVNENQGLVSEKDGVTYLTYGKEDGDKETYYMVAAYKEKEEAFWEVKFVVDFEKKEALENNFIKWAKTVKVGQ